MSVLNNLTKLSLREQAAQAIRAGIMSGEIAPDTIYSVPTLSAQLGVSATPVREAMLDLAAEGLVLPVRNRGFRVTSLSPKDLEDILQVRLLLEVPAMGHVAESRAGKDLSRFHVLAGELPRHVQDGDIQAYLDADRQFHLGLLELLGNSRLVDVVGMLRNQSRLFDVGRLAAAGDLIESAMEHGPILEAIENGDRRATERLVGRHLAKLRKSWSTEPV